MKLGIFLIIVGIWALATLLGQDFTNNGNIGFIIGWIVCSVGISAAFLYFGIARIIKWKKKRTSKNV